MSLFKVNGVTIDCSDDTNSVNLEQLKRDIRQHRTILMRLDKFKQGTRPILLEISFVTAARIKELNRDFRLKDQPTDVLSFPTYSFRTNQPAKAYLVGTIIIAPQVAKRPILFLVHHALGHLLGRHHPE